MHSCICIKNIHENTFHYNFLVDYFYLCVNVLESNLDRKFNCTSKSTVASNAFFSQLFRVVVYNS